MRAIDPSTLPIPFTLALLFAGMFFAVALLTGVWKWRAMLRSPNGRAHRYIDVAHNAALSYGPSVLLAGALAVFWPFGIVAAWVPIMVMGVTMIGSLSRYVSLGIAGKTTNQLRNPDTMSKAGLWLFLIGSCLPGLAIVAGAFVALVP